MDYRLPYYMAYPMPLQYDDERIERYDFEYMKSMYPQTAKKVLPYVEDECDRMEYEGSMMYDEYPDQLQLRLMCRRVYDRMMREEKEELEMADEEDVEQQYGCSMFPAFASMEVTVAYMHSKYAFEFSARVLAFCSFTVEISFMAFVICCVLCTLLRRLLISLIDAMI